MSDEQKPSTGGEHAAPAVSEPKLEVKTEAAPAAPAPSEASAAPAKRALEDAGADASAKREKLDINDEEAAMNAAAGGDASTSGSGWRGYDRRGGRGGAHGKGKWIEKKLSAKERNKEKGRMRGRGRKIVPGRTGEEGDEEEAQNDAGEGAAPKDGEGRKEREGGDDDEERERRLPKKKAAVLVGYCGTGYSGMQIQPHGSKTIEGDIFTALTKAGAVSEENAVDHRKVDIQRSARTDAGVHAAGNCISLKMILDPPLPEGFETLTDYVNSLLPPQIRMWGFVRTMKSFQARTACDSRVYEYLLPSYCLLPPASGDPFAKILDSVSPGWRDVVKTGLEFVDAAPPAPEPAEGEEMDPRARGEFERRRGWRIDADTLERFRALIAQYKGTHNFHNYTVGKPFNDRSVKRYMIKLDVRDPAVYGDIEWISVRIHGQSFMLHQIRKMISIAMLACRTGTPPSLLPETFGPKRIHIPKAPPLGLLLEQPQFKTYNERARTLPKTAGEQREFVNFTKYTDQMHQFKVEWIYERLREMELESNVFHKWIRQIDCTSSMAFSFLNTQGTIPDEALVTLTSKKYFANDDDKAERKRAKDDVESDDEDANLDKRALDSGEFDS